MPVRTLPGTIAYNLWELLARPDAPAVALAGAGAGNVENGAHLYAVTFVTALGESLPSYTQTVTVVDKTADGKVAVSSIAIGPAGTTARKVYRTVAAGTQLKLLTTLSDNTTTTYTDNTADAGLGANAPTNDTSQYGTPPAAVWQLIITAHSGNGNTVYVSRNASVSSTDYDYDLAANATVNLGGSGPAFLGQYWVRGGAVSQKIEVGFRPV